MKASAKISYLLGALCVLAMAGAVAAKDDLPQTTYDGLQLVKDTSLRAVYVRPGASLEQYSKLVLADCYVAFKKNWDRDYNRTHAGERITAKDMDRIKRDLAREFEAVVTEELQEKGGYEIVDHAEEDVLLVKAAIVDLEVTAPDTGRYGQTYVTSAGQMTLYAELYDSTTGAIIARVIDPAAADRNGFLMPSSRSSNKAEARRIMRKWAESLRNAMDRVAEIDVADGGTE